MRCWVPRDAVAPAWAGEQALPWEPHPGLIPSGCGQCLFQPGYPLCTAQTGPTVTGGPGKGLLRALHFSIMLDLLLPRGGVAGGSPRSPSIPIVRQPLGEGCVLWKVGCTGPAAGRARKGRSGGTPGRGPCSPGPGSLTSPQGIWDLSPRPAAPWELAGWNRGSRWGSEELGHALAPAMPMLLHSAPSPPGPPLCSTVAGPGEERPAPRTSRSLCRGAEARQDGL